MKSFDRQRKLLAISNLLQGDDRAARALKPKLTLDLDQFTANELECIRKLSPVDENRQRMLIDVELLEKTFGRPMKLIPEPHYPTF
ncbi:hypothetical protein GO755_00265 [Spirosoma sp. HMF4905]|uniref:Uncharacterized protein n=1 Tax=Spirosoma arboris TaxID=2682092 RepID=A0A7K1S3Q1_9BACT|nr:hypothetical protein [Spirosoma arboris]MVM28444.1 hypothetical protein [Spirosoma arboris]